ncbi:MAG: hypothetical protein RIS64_565 [Bacteroidota bacterium]|jgi:hypothetical protein
MQKLTIIIPAIALSLAAAQEVQAQQPAQQAVTKIVAPAKAKPAAAAKVQVEQKIIKDPNAGAYVKENGPTWVEHHKHASNLDKVQRPATDIQKAATKLKKQ